MKIESLSIRNFRGIQYADINGLGNTIVIAGQNGSGKSCIFDAIRLLKSTYGGYQNNEWQHFFGEFQIAMNGASSSLKGLFHDLNIPLTIECDFRLSDQEKGYISNNCVELLEECVWQKVLPDAFQFGGYRKSLFAAQFRDKKPEVDAQVQNLVPLVHQELAYPTAAANLTVKSNATFDIKPSNLLTIMFSVYRPRDLGVIDYHGPQRHYSREQVQGINLNLDAIKQNYSQSTLYNYNNKYNNVKSEMAGNYISSLLSDLADPNTGDRSSLSETLQDLFAAFFPDKHFLGPKPTKDGSLSFPVVTGTGNEHDLDELSSGEKEILYGYLRIRSSAPKESIILLDEPELHLNPRLIRGLPEFYRKHLSERLQNQLWLVTHSDALIREAVGRPGFNVFHMLPSGTHTQGTSQLRSLNVTADLDAAITDLVGDLAAYRPGGKGLIFEGGGDADFDKSLVAALFPEEVRGINLISGTNKARVKALHEVLHRAYEKGDTPTKFYAVVDKDAEEEPNEETAVRRFQWDVYHIENYLLIPEVISDVLRALGMAGNLSSTAVFDKLNTSARNTVTSLINKRMKSFVNSKLVRCIDLGFPTKTLTVSKLLSEAASRSVHRALRVFGEELTPELLLAEEQKIKEALEASFADGSWLATMPGRDILRNFVSVAAVPVKYEILRNLIQAQMVSKGVKPQGMASIISRIRED